MLLVISRQRILGFRQCILCCIDLINGILQQGKIFWAGIHLFTDFLLFLLSQGDWIAAFILTGLFSLFNLLLDIRLYIFFDPIQIGNCFIISQLLLLNRFLQRISDCRIRFTGIAVTILICIISVPGLVHIRFGF